MHVLSEVKFASSLPRKANAPLRSRFFGHRRALMPGFLVFALLLATSGCEEKEKAPPPSPPEVTVTDVVVQNVPVYGEWVAQLNGPVNADITPKVQGYLLKQAYLNGFFVKKGQLLYELDPRPFVAALEQAKAQVAVAVANQGEAENNVARDTPLAAQSAIPQKQLDTDKSTLAAQIAQVSAAQANQANAELNLEWTKVYSPIDGVAGNSTSQVGDLVGTTTKMTTISQVNPIWAYFNISEADYLSRARAIAAFVMGEKGRPKSIPVEFIQANGEPFPEKGNVVLVNREIASQTGTIQLAAAFPNKDGFLRPGGYGTVRIETGMNENALLVPQPAVIEVQSQYQIIVLTPENKAVYRPIKVGERVGPNWIVTDGLKPGERVVVEGVERLRMFAAAAPQMAKEGIPVIAKPYVPASAAAGGN
jgi:membrane fusion protein (multidrug efflux system)